MSELKTVPAGRFVRNSIVPGVVAGLVLGALLAAALAQDRPQGGRVSTVDFPDLVGGLKAIPGCLGVETAMTASGKSVIFAWFEDKKAVLRWYYSDMHQQVMKQFFPGGNYRTPLQEVSDDSGPILAIASLTMAEKSQHKPTSLPVSQIAIELYQPITGGLFLGGRLAPDSLKVPRLRDYTPKTK